MNLASPWISLYQEFGGREFPGNWERFSPVSVTAKIGVLIAHAPIGLETSRVAICSSYEVFLAPRD